MRTYPLVAVALLLAGCASTPYLDSHFGEAVDLVKAQQTLDPLASTRPTPPASMDGLAAQEAMQRYQASFKEPPPTVNIINIGAPGKSSTGQ